MEAAMRKDQRNRRIVRVTISEQRNIKRQATFTLQFHPGISVQSFIFLIGIINCVLFDLSNCDIYLMEYYSNIVSDHCIYGISY